MRKLLCVVLSVCMVMLACPATAAAAPSETLEVTPRSSMHWTTETCPYGSASDYGDYRYCDKEPDVVMAEGYKSMTISAICDAISAGFPGYGLIVSALAQILQNMPDTEAGSDLGASFMAYHYWHSTEGHRVPALGARIYVDKVVVYCYSKANYMGTCRVYTYYDCVSYY